MVHPAAACWATASWAMWKLRWSVKSRVAPESARSLATCAAVKAVSRGTAMLPLAMIPR